MQKVPISKQEPDNAGFPEYGKVARFACPEFLTLLCHRDSKAAAGLIFKFRISVPTLPCIYYFFFQQVFNITNLSFCRLSTDFGLPCTTKHNKSERMQK